MSMLLGGAAGVCQEAFVALEWCWGLWNKAAHFIIYVTPARLMRRLLASITYIIAGLPRGCQKRVWRLRLSPLIGDTMTRYLLF